MPIPAGVVDSIEQCWKDLKTGIHIPDMPGDGTKLPAEEVGLKLLAHLVWYTGGICSVETVKEVLGDRLTFCAVRVEHVPEFGNYIYTTEIVDGMTTEARADVEVLTFYNFKSVMASQNKPALLTYVGWAVDLAEAAKQANRGHVATGFRRMASELRRKYVGLGEYTCPEDGWYLYHLRFPNAVSQEDLQWHLKSH